MAQLPPDHTRLDILNDWTRSTREVAQVRAPWRPGVATALIVYLSGVITMIIAGVALIVLGPQG